MTPEPARPDPDELLARTQAAEKRAARGKLKIFFGASAGVGKTYAMLGAALRLREQQIDVVVGLVETHGRAETLAQLQGLEQLPLRRVHADSEARSGSRTAGGLNSKTITEFDLDAALARHPAVLLVDELAHSNAAGSRHPKRWQDIEELRAAGIDVLTTVNVQHIESLNDVVGGITGIRVWETVPDHVFDEADEVVLVDLPTDDLLERLKEGKVYLPEQAERAVQNFFRKGNLMALRELALRRTADRVDDDMRSYRREHVGAAKVWPVSDALPVCVDPQPGADKLVRAGAEGWLRGGRFKARLAAIAADIDLMLVSEDGSSRASRDRVAVQRDIEDGEGRRTPWSGYAWAAGSSIAVVLIAAPLLRFFDLANIVMLFLLAVVFVAMRFGRRPAFAAAVLNVAAFDFFFVPPRLTFAVGDAQYLLTFAVMMIVGLVVGQLTANLRYQARVARYREDRARSLYEMARELGTALMPEQVAEIGDRHVENAFRAKALVLLADADDRLVPASAHMGETPDYDAGLAQWCFDHGEAAGAGTDTLPGSALLYVPLKAPMRTRGVIAVEPANPRLLMIPEQRQLLDTYAALVAIATERVHFVTVAQETLVSMESERLRNSLLAALSHDLRTPLTALVGMSETLSAALVREGSGHAEVSGAIHAQALRVVQMVSDLLDMARLQSGAVNLRHDWQSLEELAGSAIRSVQSALVDHPVVVDLPAELPLLYADAVLIERVLANLFENAAKYTPPGTAITLTARREREVMVIEVADDGPGLLPALLADNGEALFRKFSRGETESSTPGVGLGLAICRAIVRAHGGEISAGNRPAPGHGAVFRWTLPYRAAPALNDDKG